MIHVTYTWVTSHISHTHLSLSLTWASTVDTDGSCHVETMSRVEYRWFMSYTHKSRDISFALTSLSLSLSALLLFLSLILSLSLSASPSRSFSAGVALLHLGYTNFENGRFQRVVLNKMHPACKMHRCLHAKQRCLLFLFEDNTCTVIVLGDQIVKLARRFVKESWAVSVSL